MMRSALFRLDPETAHRVSLLSLDLAARLGPFNPLRQAIPASERTVMGLRFTNPVGLAAGLDKDGDCIDGFGALGFGFVELGTVTPRPQPGNPKPRLFRLPAAEALINRMGFNNKGVEHLVARVKAARFGGVIGINIGKNLLTPLDRALDDYRAGMRAVYAHAGYIAVNISSPNTPGLRDLQHGADLDRLLAGLTEEAAALAASHGRKVPVALKIAPDLGDDDLDQLAQALLRHGLDGVIATNTTSSRGGVAGLPHGDEAGGLSGRPLLDRSTEIVARLADRLAGALPIIACGGIFSGADARRKIDAGASLVQIYTGLIYRGPRLIAEIAEAIG
ncbi:MAG: quinone-dependent dihydroorotate dehydrogenase [Methylotetracoccus sp.]